MKKKFKTVDLLTLYYGKPFPGCCYTNVIDICEFLLNKHLGMTPIPNIAMQKPITLQIKWLNALRLPDRKTNSAEWLENLLKTHGELTDLEPFDKKTVAQILAK